MAALGVPPHHGLVGQAERVQLVRGADRVQDGARLPLSDQVRVGPLGPEPDVVGGHHDPAAVHHLVQRRRGAGRERVVEQGRRTALGHAGRAVRPGDDRARAVRELLGGDHQGARDGRLALVPGGRVEDPPRLGALGQRTIEGLAPHQLPRLGRYVVRSGVEVVRHRGAGVKPEADQDEQQGECEPDAGAHHVP